MNTTKSPAKLMLIKFLQATRDKDQFQFRLHGTPEEAQKFIHRMRVELSRMREMVKESGRTRKEFKMMLQAITFDTKSGISISTLKKVEGKSMQIDEDVSEIFDTLAKGDSGK